MNMLGNNLSCMLFQKDGGRKQVFKEMKTFYNFMVEQQKMHYQSIVLGLYVAAFGGGKNVEFKITQKQLLQKDVKILVTNLQSDFKTKLRKCGVWKDKKDYNFKSLYYRHRDILKWSRFLD